jgi:zinc protease
MPLVHSRVPPLGTSSAGNCQIVRHCSFRAVAHDHGKFTPGSPILAGLCLLSILMTSFASASAADKVFPYAYQKATLPNGLTVVMVPMSSPGLAAYFTVVRTGSRDEVEPGRSGYAHFFEHMMFRGTKKYPGPVYDRIVTGIGARANASTTDDFTMYHLTFAKEDLEKVIDIESDRFQNLSYEKPAFQTEAGAIYGEYRIGAAQPWFALHEKIQDLAFRSHTYKHTTMGFEADVKAMPEGYDYSLAFYRRFYRPENVVLLVVGDIDPPATLRLVEKYYGPWRRGYEPPKITPEPPQTSPKSAEITFPGRTLPILVVAYKGDAFDPSNRDYVAARLLGELAFGQQSELYKKLVLREQRVEALHCDVPVNRDQPLFDISAMVKQADDVDSVREEIYRTLEEFKTRPVDKQKLDDLNRRDRYAFVMGLDTPDKVAGRLARFAAVTGGIDAIETLFAAAEKVTPEDILAAGSKYFVPERRTVVVLKGAGEKGEGRKEKVEGRGAKGDAIASKGDPKRGGSDEEESPRNHSLPLDQLGGASAVPQGRTVLLPVTSDPTVSFRIWFQVGSYRDPPGKEGLAAITAAMLTEGATKQNSYEQILDKLFPLAASYAASTTVEMTVISARVHKDNLDKFYPLLVQAIREPAFRQKDLDRIKSQTLNYLENTLRYSSDEELGKAVLYGAVFPDARYGHLPAGTVASVRGITLDDVKRFYWEFFTRRMGLTSSSNVLGLGGGYDESLIAKLYRDVGMSEATFAFGPFLPNTPPRGRRVTIVEKDCGATAISIGFPIDVLRGQKDWYALAVANSWFGQHRNQSSHLYQVIREARGLNYGDYSYIEHFPHGSHLLTPPVNVCRRQQIFEIWIRPVPHTARVFALRAALRELKKLVDNGMTEEEFNTTRSFLRKYVLHLAPTTTERLGYALDDRFYGIEGSHLEKFRQAMDTITLAEVNAAIKKYLQYENMEIVLVTKDAAGLKDALVGDAPSPITYATPKPEAVLAEDREISTFPLKIRAEDVRIVPVSELFVK